VAAIGQGLGGRRALDRHGQVAGDQQDGAEDHRLAGPQIAIGQEAADQRQQIDQRGVGAVVGAGGLRIEQEVLGQVEDQDAAHAVVGEALPHLGEEQDQQPPGVIPQQLDQHGDAGQDRDQDAHDDDDVHSITLTQSGDRDDAMVVSSSPPPVRGEKITRQSV
jgi:hypothetical protein